MVYKHIKFYDDFRYAQMGSSGSGKTTLISCVVGILSLDSGSIKVFDQPASKLLKTRIGYMPQEIALINGFSVREMMWFFGTIYGLSSDKINERLQFLSELLEFPDEDRLIRDCSGGQQRRISFGLALIHEPEILILDEPTVREHPHITSHQIRLRSPSLSLINFIIRYFFILTTS